MSYRKHQPLACNREACPNPAHPCGYNAVTQSYYCLSCAQVGRPAFYPLAYLSPLIDAVRGGTYVTGTILVSPEALAKGAP